MDELISILKKFESVILLTGTEGIEMRHILALGAPKCGKSSVLESIIKYSFLPKGDNNNIPVPVVIQLVHSSETPPSKSDFWAKFNHNKKIFTSLLDIKNEITLESNSEKNGEPVVLRFYSQKVPDLTLIDLPSITSNETKEISKKYLNNQNAIILAVMSEGIDYELINFIKNYDPWGHQTIIVYTKLDKETSDFNLLISGKIKKMKYKTVGVINQKEEASILYNIYPDIAQFNGSKYLITIIKSLVLNQLKSTLPILRHKVNYIAQQQQLVIHPYGLKNTSNKEFLLNILSKYAAAYISGIQGNAHNLETVELGGGARINFIFQELFSKTIQSIVPLNNLSSFEILTAIKNASGVRPLMFLSDNCFSLLVQKQISLLKEPSLKCSQLVYEEMERLMDNCNYNISYEVSRFPKLHLKLYEVVLQLLRKRLPYANDMILKIFKIQCSYINTAHPDFINLTEQFNYQENLQIKEYNKKLNSVPEEVLLFENLISIYFNIVKKTIEDSVPKAIMCFLVNYVTENLLSELVSEIYEKGNCEELLEESVKAVRQREMSTSLLASIEKADAIITELKESTSLKNM